MNTAQAQQFAALQKATSNFNNDGRMADHARRREADMVVRASEQDRRDTEELRKAHGEFGEETRKRKNLEVERRRCKQASEADREAIIKITSELNGIEADEREQKIHFVKEMEALNNENDIILTHRENKKLSHLLDAETANWLVGIELDDAAVVAARNGTMDDDCAEVADNWGGESSRWSEEVSARVKDEAADLIEIEGRGDDLTRKTNEMKMFLQQLRARFLLEHSNLGQVEIDDLEAKWMQQQYERDICEEEEGAENATDDNDDDDNDDGDEKAGNGPTRGPTGGGGGPSAIHMNLFYDNNDHE